MVPASNALANAATASARCSALSSTSSMALERRATDELFHRRALRREAHADRLGDRSGQAVRRRQGRHLHEPDTGAPHSLRVCRRQGARLVLPMPPMPISVTSRCACIVDDNVASSVSRP